VTVALDVELARWTLGRWTLDSFEATLRDELAKYNIAVVDRRKETHLVTRINLGLPGYREAIDIDLVRDGAPTRLPRVMVPDLQPTTLDVAAQLIASEVARAVWYPATLPATPATPREEG
jgi:hypothetical protein